MLALEDRIEFEDMQHAKRVFSQMVRDLGTGEWTIREINLLDDDKCLEIYSQKLGLDLDDIVIHSRESPQ